MLNIDIPQLEIRDGVYYLEITAKTGYERGYQHGKALEVQINQGIFAFKEWLKSVAKIEDPELLINEFIKNTGYVESVKEHSPHLYEEMQGISDASGVEFNQLFVYQSLDELYYHLYNTGHLSDQGGHCTTTGVYGREDKSNIISHNNDLPTYHEGLVTVLHITFPDSDLEILQGTFAGQIGQNGINNFGVAVGVNLIADLPNNKTGVPLSFNVRKILEQRSVSDSVKYLETTEFAQPINYMIADRNTVVSVETWMKETKVLDNNANFFAHTNHSLNKDISKTFEVTSNTGGGSLGNTLERLNLAVNRLSTNTSEVSIKDIMNLCSTEPILVYPGKPTGRTIQSVVIDIPKQGSPVLYMTPDSPNLHEYVEFSFKNRT